MAASICFSVLTTAFTMFVMRRGVLVVGEGQQSLWRDLRRMPSLIAAFVVSSLGALRVAAGFRRKAVAVEQEFEPLTHPSG